MTLNHVASGFGWRLFSEVFLQSQVIRQRPLPGLAHAFVFWGFCAFALVTLNHVASGFGWRLFSYESGFGRIYGWLAALFGIAVAVAISGLFVRRFVARPKWLGEVSPESGVIAGLIFLLMVTYLVQFFAGDSRIVWWGHTAALLIFLPLAPKTKHLHLILSPFTIWEKHATFAYIPPLAESDLDEDEEISDAQMNTPRSQRDEPAASAAQGEQVDDDDFGLITGRDVTQITALQAFSCVECGRCTEHCPAFNTGKVLNPKQIALGVRSYLNELGPRSDEPLLGEHLSEEAVFQCTTCGACEFQCPVGIQHLPMIVGLRRGATNTGEWDDEYGAKLFRAIERNGNALAMPSAERTKFIEAQEFPIFDGSQEYCLWLGCMGSYDPQGREIIADFARVMRHLGTSFGVLKKEKCTGDPARRLGNDLAFGQLAEEGLAGLAKAKVAKIVSICPHCVRTISTDWKEYAEDPDAIPPIEHHSEFLARHAARLPGPTDEDADEDKDAIVYHDPCYLGRYRGRYDEPREIVRASGELVEPGRTRERSFCCGAGGGLTFLGEESGERVSHNRAAELIKTDAAVVAAACPFCNSMLRDALKASAQHPPELLDIAQIVAARLPKQT